MARGRIQNVTSPREGEPERRRQRRVDRTEHTHHYNTTRQMSEITKRKKRMNDPRSRQKENETAKDFSLQAGLEPATFG